MSEEKRYYNGSSFEIHLKGYIINKMVLSTQCYDELNEWLEKKNENEQSGDTQIKN